jgi:hypothetical protein
MANIPPIALFRSTPSRALAHPAFSFHRCAASSEPKPTCGLILLLPSTTHYIKLAATIESIELVVSPMTVGGRLDTIIASQFTQGETQCE